MRAWRAKNLSRSHDINRKSRQKNYKKWAPQINKMRRSLYNQTGWSKHMRAWFKRWVTDGWLTEGKQIACPPGMVKSFAVCTSCRQIFPHWVATMTVNEAKARGFIGCRCGGMRVQPQRIPVWRSVWWFVVRGWFMRHVLTTKRIWDPRMPVLENDFS